MPYKKNLSWIICQRFGHVSISGIKLMARKVLVEGLPTDIPDLEEPVPICLLTKSTQIYVVLTIDVSTPPPGFMLHIYFAFLMLK